MAYEPKVLEDLVETKHLLIEWLVEASLPEWVEQVRPLVVTQMVVVVHCECVNCLLSDLGELRLYTDGGENEPPDRLGRQKIEKLVCQLIQLL